MIYRVLSSLILLFSILFMPIWVSVILGMIGMIFFPLFLEAIFLFFLSDLLFGVSEASLLNVTFVSLIFALAVFLVIELLKRKLRFQTKFK